MFFLWTELYGGMDYKEYTRIQNLMDANSIPIKAKTILRKEGVRWNLD